MEINQIIFIHKSPSKTWFSNVIHSLLRGADVRERALTPFTVCDAYR